jgi:ubiquinone/menaquinone biosynthesis C-methylase UbiE
MKPEEVHKYLTTQHRNIYQEAQLFEQNRRNVSDYVNLLAHPNNPTLAMSLSGGKLSASNGDGFLVKNNVIDFRQAGDTSSELHKKWEELNKFLVNYQQYLTPYVLINTLPLYNYIGEKTGLCDIKNARVVDVGAGTGQTYGTFFRNQDSIEYFLCDPNLRLIHDQFLRLYPRLVKYPIGHILCFAENLPFKSGSVDLVTSFSSIDHFIDYKKFMVEAYRILKPGGHILISSHLDGPGAHEAPPAAPKELANAQAERTFMKKIFNRLALKSEFYARRYHNKKRGVVEDDHTHHFEDTRPLEESLKQAGFIVQQAEVFHHHFFVKALKPAEVS